jgi:hypothetical protein
MLSEGIILAVLSTGVGLAGLLLIFSGFLVSKAASFSSTSRADKYKWLALSTIIPILFALLLSWMSIDALEGVKWAHYYLLTVLKIELVLTALFSIIGLWAVAD